MKIKSRRKRNLPLLLAGGAIPAFIVLSIVFNIPEAAVITLLIVLGIIFCSMALWSFANRNADGSEWWQDDSASGWRGY
jgi:ABC-type transport system involved in cytochrome bd biosynthesis fused ATPase/permease subunit